MLSKVLCISLKNIIAMPRTLDVQGIAILYSKYYEIILKIAIIPIAGAASHVGSNTSKADVAFCSVLVFVGSCSYL